SQFFINTVDNKYLDKENPSTPYAHPVFGEVVAGMDVVDSIGKVKTGRNDRPLTDVTINKIDITD
ncbi:MAG: peptidylprolyl isomerase, partial [Candidatus Methanomethylophilaceae archaeon]